MSAPMSTQADLPTGRQLDLLVLWALATIGTPSYVSEILTAVCIKLGDDGMYRSVHDERAIMRSLDRLRAAGVVEHDPDGFGYHVAKEPKHA